MTALNQIFAALAILANGVIYGTDAFSATVLHPALAALDDATLTQAAGRVHEYGDRRLPVPGVIGIAACGLSAVFATLAGNPLAAGLSGAALAALLLWLVLYARVAAPINRQLTAAARAHVTPQGARAMQRRWDSIIVPRVALQGVALALLIATLAAV
jgi:hypothetical protein